MLDKLAALEDEFTDVEARLADPDVFTDQARYRDLARRHKELEAIACEFPGVEQAFAVQAGRELRVIVSAKDTTDETAAKACRDIVRAFEERLTYPGEIKVTVLRETRFTEVAR